VKILLDTHVWLWMQAEPEKLGALARTLVEDEEHELLFSAASVWEIAIKVRAGKLHLPEPVSRYVPSRMQSSGVAALAVTHAHASGVADLPGHHRDPFDRLLIAQALAERVPILSSDAQLDAYDAERIAAS
jgi:PIN domain nuclease of toxin-antitoxin system